MNNIKSFIAYLLVVVFVLGSIAASAGPVRIETSAGNDTFKAIEQSRKAGIETIDTIELKKAAEKNKI